MAAIDFFGEVPPHPQSGDPGDALQLDADLQLVWAPAGGASSSPVNWCLVDLSEPDPLTPGSTHYTWTADAMAISAQSGSDFSIADDPNHAGQGAVLSATGGRFQCAAYMQSPTDATLDGGSTHQRWLWFGAVAGSTNNAENPLNFLGIDQIVPILSAADGGNTTQVLAASTIGYAVPGGVCAGIVAVAAAPLTGTDSIPLDDSGPYQLVVWQV